MKLKGGIWALGGLCGGSLTVVFGGLCLQSLGVSVQGVLESVLERSHRQLCFVGLSFLVWPQSVVIVLALSAGPS